jgi:NAD(P)-dependent dehydrogenase (short-subunit alcohol dehydrogenase family)
MTDKKHIIIIGASSGVGAAIANFFEGMANISILARRYDRLKNISENDETIYPHSLDLFNPEEIDQVLDNCLLKFGKVDAIIYCAGMQIIKPHRMMKIDDFDNLYKVNLLGTLIATKWFCQKKNSKEGAVFCALSSIAAEKPEPGIITYSALKSAMSNLISGLAKEYTNKRFVAIAPGWLDTEMTKGQAAYTEKFIDELEKKSPLGIASVDDIVNMVAFAIGDNARKVTGQTFIVDGGASL